MSEWPTNSELTTALSEAGFTAPGSSRLTSALTLAKAAFEDATGWVPFAAAEGATAQTLRLSWPADTAPAIVSFGGGLLSGEDITLTLDSDEMESTDYQLCPVDAARKGQPYTYVRLLGSRLYPTSKLEVEGVWGWCAFDEVPEMARQAVLAYAAKNIAAPLVQAGDGDRAVVSEKQEDVTYTYGSSAEERLAAIKAWEADWASAVKKYKRLEVR